ncbi:MAG: acyl-CoA dehydrogenase C-terminal domain-containing protein, partial [Pseudomonadota bacterium]
LPAPSRAPHRSGCAPGACPLLEGGTSDEDFYKAKLKTGRYYMSRRLPATGMHLARIQSGAGPVMELEEALF